MAIDVPQWPSWPMIGKVLSYFPSLRGLANPYTVASATLINRQAVLTAAHVIYDPTYGGRVDKFDIYFGDGSSHLGVPSASGKVRQEWISSGSTTTLSNVDAGVILLNRTATPAPAVPLQTDESALLGVPIDVIGFPADPLVPQFYGSLFRATTSAYDMGPIYNGFRIGYLDFTYSGMSGGPVLRVDEINNGTFIVRGVHTSLYNNMGNGLMLYDDLAKQVSSWAAGS